MLTYLKVYLESLILTTGFCKERNYDMKKKLLYSEMMKEWFAIKRNEIAKSTGVKYHGIYNKYIHPFFSDFEVSSVNEEVLGRYRIFLEDTLLKNDRPPGSEAGRCAAMLVNKCLDYAAEKGLLENPIHFKWKTKSPKKEIIVFTQEEQRKIEQYCMDNQDLYSMGIILCLYTGIRIGELCALRWSDVNSEERIIRIERTVQRLETETGASTALSVSYPKSMSSIRSIPLPDCLKKAFRDVKCGHEKDYIFTKRPDIPGEPRTFQYRYRRYLKAAGVRYRKFHTLRHTFATRCLACGMDMKTLSEILGHSSVRITLEYYCHTSMEQKKEQMNKLYFLS